MTGRVDVVDREQLKLLRESGCEIILYGLECANNEILKAMKKNITVEQAIEAIKLTKEAGIFPMVAIMFGQPGETLQDFARSLKIGMMSTDRNLPSPNIASIMPLLTLPGAPIYRYALEHGYIKDDTDHYKKFFRGEHMNYTQYSRETIMSAVELGNKLYRWQYHHTMAKHIEDELGADPDLLAYAVDKEAGILAEGETDFEKLPGYRDEVERLVNRCLSQYFINPELVEKGYKGFNIIKFSTKYYGLSWEDGAFDIDKARKKEYKRCFPGDSIEEVKRLIDDSLNLALKN